MVCPSTPTLVAVTDTSLRLPRLLSSRSDPSFPSSTASSCNASNPRPYVALPSPSPILLSFPHTLYLLSISILNFDSFFFFFLGGGRTTQYQKTATGIYLPTSATSSPLPEATVIAVGPGAPDKEGRLVPTAVKAGDRVLLPGWGGNAIKVGEEVRSVCFFLVGGRLIRGFCLGIFLFFYNRNISCSRMRRFWPRLRSRREE